LYCVCGEGAIICTVCVAREPRLNLYCVCGEGCVAIGSLNFVLGVYVVIGCFLATPVLDVWYVVFAFDRVKGYGQGSPSRVRYPTLSLIALLATIFAVLST
jgi:Mg2+/Co2+ transporter CorB